MFERAVRLELRFNYKGVLSVEDLWHLNVRELDSLYKELNAELKTLSEDSLLEVATKEDEIVQLKVDIVKHIVKTKLTEQEAKEQELERRAKKQRLLEIIATKQDEQYKGMSLEELNNLVNDL